MKTRLFNRKKLWLVISLFILVGTGACKSKKTTSPDSEQPTIESPKPVTEYQTDSLKKALDEKRKSRIKK